MTKRTANILLAVLGSVLVVIVVLVAGGAWFALSVFHRETTDDAGAAAAFTAARARFAGTTPLFELHPEGPALTRAVPATPAQTRLRTMHVMVWDPTADTLTNADVPLALLRFRDDPIDVLRFAGAANHEPSAREIVPLRPSELDRFGSALLLDHETPDGHRLLVWTD